MFNQKKKYFKGKLKAVERTIWDLEFKRFKTLELREEARQAYDEDIQRMTNLDQRIEAEKKNPTMSKDDAKHLDDDKVRLQVRIDRSLANIKQLDLELDGSAPTAELQQGYNGIKQQLDAFRELVQMLKDYIKRQL